MNNIELIDALSELLATKLAPDKFAQTQKQLNKLKTEYVNASYDNSNFNRKWPAAIGWVCVLALFWSFVGGQILEFILTLLGYSIKIPPIDTGELVALTTTILGLRGWRVLDKSMKGK